MSLRVSSCVSAMVSLALCSVASAKGTVTLDFGVNTEDKLLSLRLGQDGRVYALVDLKSDAVQCGLYALDQSGSLIAGFGRSGRTILRTYCARDFVVRADNSVVSAADRFATPGVNLIFLDANGKETAISKTNLSLFSGNRVEAVALSLQPDNKIALAGRSSYGGVARDYNWEVFRWNADGSVDEDFGAVPLEFEGSSSKSGADGVAFSQGKVLVSGVAGSDGALQSKLHQLLDNGTDDEAFGTKGLYVVPGTIAPEAHAPGGLAVDSANGKIYWLAGNAVDVIRLTAAGAPDGSFATQSTPAGRVPQSIALDSSGRAVVAGVTSEAGGGLKGYLTRFTTTGALDKTFGAGTGVVYAPLTRPIFQDLPSCRLAIQQSTGQLILGCTVDNGADPQGYHVSDLTIARFNADGSLDESFGAAQKDSDIRPDNFSFNTASVPAGTANVQSNAVTISGIDGPTTVRLYGASTSGSAFSIGCNGTFTDQPAQISSGQTLCVRHHASSTPQASVQTGIDVGGLYVTYTTQSTSVAADTTPDPFTFPSVTNATPGSSVLSDTIAIKGFDGVAPISIQNGEYFINCSQSGTQPTTIVSGQTVCVRQTVSAQANTSVTTTLTIGGVSGTFTSTTTADGGNGAPSFGPVAFTFQSQNNVARSALVTSNAVTVKGFGAPVTITITNGEYSVGCNQSFSSGAGTISDGTQLCVRHMSSGSYATTVRTDITLDSGAAQYSTSFTSTTVGGSTTVTNGGGGGGGALDYLFLSVLAAIGAFGRALGFRSQRKPS